MISSPTKLNDVYVIEPKQINDERGFFAPLWSANEFAALGVSGNFVEANLSYNEKRGTLRGLHWQAEPHSQDKLVSCIRGSVFDVAVDLRRSSETYGQWTSVELSAANHLMLYVPTGFAHGYLTLENHSEVLYLVTGGFVKESGQGMRWNDPAFDIRWPDVGELTMNYRDRSYPDFQL